MRHVLIAALYAACVAAFFASLLRDEWKPALRYFAVVFGVMTGSVIALGWLMAWITPGGAPIP